jgi:hypothetical protein
MKQRLILERKNGEILSDISASVQNKIYINDITLQVEEGDAFEYVLPSGLKQRLLVTKVTLYNMGRPIDHYEIEYTKD